MPDIPVPYERLKTFRERLNLVDSELVLLDPYVERLIAHSERFGAFFEEFFFSIPHTRIILQYQRRPGRIAEVLSRWFAQLFTRKFDAAFLEYLWKSGLRHVELNLDQRYVNLGYAAARQYCQEVLGTEIPAAEQRRVVMLVDRMLDFCVLVATDALLSATSHCDVEVIKGISHQVRNPVTVIGGNIRRLQRKVEPASPVYGIYETIIQENLRLERMVADIAAYTELHLREPKFEKVSLEPMVWEVLHRLRERYALERVRTEVCMDPGNLTAYGDPRDLGIMFSHLLENGIEALDLKDPVLSVSSRPCRPKDFVRIEVFNTGIMDPRVSVEHLFAPFYSSKPAGTGFGLPIALLAARKNLGSVSLESLAGKGVRCTVELPAAEARAIRMTTG